MINRSSQTCSRNITTSRCCHLSIQKQPRAKYLIAMTEPWHFSFHFIIMTHKNVTFKSSEKHILNVYVLFSSKKDFFFQGATSPEQTQSWRENVRSSYLQRRISASLVTCPFAIPALSPCQETDILFLLFFPLTQCCTIISPLTPLSIYVHVNSTHLPQH